MKTALRILIVLCGPGFFVPANAAGLDQLKGFLDTNRSARGMFSRP
jgi:hypothetical protein